MKRCLTILLLILCIIESEAQSFDVIVTKDGNEYTGLITKQVPGTELSIECEQAVLTVYSPAVTVRSSSLIKYNTLPESQACFFHNLTEDSYVEKADLLISSQDGSNVLYPDVLLLEKGAVYKFVSFNKKRVDLSWASVAKSIKTPYDYSNNYGIYDALLLNDARRIDGQLIEQDLTKGIYKFYDRKSQQVLTFKKNEIKAVRYEVVNVDSTPFGLDKSYWAQIPFRDKIVKKDGNFIEGFIESKIFGESVSIRDYVTGNASEIPVSDIDFYERFKNSEYKQNHKDGVAVDTVTVIPELLINGEEKCTFPLVEKKLTYVVDAPIYSFDSVVYTNSPIRIKYKKGAAKTSDFRFASASSCLMSVGPRNFETRLSFLKNRTHGAEPFKTDVISNEGGFIEMELTFSSKGNYVIFVEGSNRCIVLKVVNR